MSELCVSLSLLPVPPRIAKLCHLSLIGLGEEFSAPPSEIVDFCLISVKILSPERISCPSSKEQTAFVSMPPPEAVNVCLVALAEMEVSYPSSRGFAFTPVQLP